MRDMYETETYAEKNPTWHEEDSPWKAGHIERMIRKNDLPHQTIAEIGCGAGEILLNLEKAFPQSRLSGYEISPYALSIASKKQTDRTHFYIANVLEQDDVKFDIVLAIDVFEHVEDYLTFIKKLRERGRAVIFHIPLDLSVQSIFRGTTLSRLRRDVGHIHSFYKQSALETLEDCGFEVVDYHYTASRLELPNQALSSQIMKWPRKIAYSIHKDFAVRVLGGYSLLVLAKSSAN